MRRRRIPFVQQMETADCGAACLATVLAYYGKRVELREVRERTGSGRGGVTALALLEAGESYGLRGSGVQLGPEDLLRLPRASILHWGSNHFVVYDRLERTGVRVVDPAAGRRLVSLGDIREKVTGVALTFEPGERFEPGGEAPRHVRNYLRRVLVHSGLFARVLLISLLVQVAALAVPLFTSVLVDRVLPGKEFDLLTVMAAGLVAMVAFYFLAGLARSYCLVRLRTAIDRQMILGFMDHLAELPYDFFLNRLSGDVLGRYDSNRRVREILTSGALSTLFDGALLVIYLVLLLLASPKIALLALALAALHIALFLWNRLHIKELASRALEVQARAQSVLVEMLLGMETLKCMGAERRAVEQWSKRFAEELDVEVALGRTAAWNESVRAALGIGSPLAILVLGAHQVLQGELTLGIMLGTNVLAAGFLVPLGSLLSVALTFEQLKSHAERIEDVLKTPPEQDRRLVVPAPRLGGGIVLQDVSFAYRGAEPPILRHVSLEIPAGRKVAIVGRSGSGKSTLARLVVGLHRPFAGRVLYDGVNLDQLDLRTVRRQIGVVTQGARIFGVTMRENIALADPGVEFESIVRAAKLAEIHEDIMAMPLGYDTLLVDGGSSLSGGQRQRLALARALLREPAILLLDEATSELDAMTEHRIMANLAALRTTRIVIAHRLNTVVDADMILVLSQGRLLDVGTHQELLDRRGIYADLVATQAILQN